MQAGLSTKNAPSPSVVLPYYAYGAVAFIAAAIMMFFAGDDIASTYMTSKVLSIAHVMILGWITMIIFGALYQLIPVVMEVKLFSEKLAMASFISLGLGTPLMAYSFWVDFIGASHAMMTGGGLVIVSVLMFVVNVFGSASKTENKTIENRFIATSVVWLLLTVLLGLSIVLFPQILADGSFQIHIHLGIIGWFMMLVVGVASTLMPMFFIAHQLNKKCLERAYILINAGLVILVSTMFFDLGNYAKIGAGVVILMGFMMFFKYNLSAYKKRLRRNLDIGMKLSVLAFVLFALTMLAGFLSAFGSLISAEFLTRINMTYGISLIFGFLTALILGQMYKTLPFIVWLKLYQDKVGKFKTPLPADMHSEEAAQAHYFFFIGAFGLLLAGVWFKEGLLIQASAAFMLLTALLYGYNTYKILIHKQQLKPLVMPKMKPRPKPIVKK
jgi:cbb3-type cytochrome oxidase subunit 1